MSTNLHTVEEMINANNEPSANKEEANKNKSSSNENDKKIERTSTGKKRKKDKKKKDENKEENKKDEPKQEEPKQEESKKEEPKNEEPKKEDPKKEEEKKEEGPKVEGEKKEEKKEEEKKESKKPREPEPKIPTDFTQLINELNDLKKEGNNLYKNGSLEEAISKYKIAHEKLEKELPKIDKERDYNPQSSDLFTLFIQLSQNLSQCYFKTEKYQESIDLDNKIISRDVHYDKSYCRLFKCYLKLDKKEEAVYFGEILLKFDEETKKKYEDVIPLIEETRKEVQAKIDAIRAKERKEMFKSIAKYAVPIVVLIGAFALYFFFFKKKKIGK